jgi:hypothetical protein
MKEIILKTIICSFAFLFLSCENLNTQIEQYPKINVSERVPVFAIDWSTNLKTKNLYYTNAGIILSDTFSTKQSICLRKNKFIAKLISPKSEDFVLFDLDSKINENQNIEINYLNSKKNFYCILQNKIITKEKLEVYIFRIKDWGRYPESGSLVLDLIVLVTKKYGVIGSYYTNNDLEAEKIMISPAGDLLREYIDYSKVQEMTLK